MNKTALMRTVSEWLGTGSNGIDNTLFVATPLSFVQGSRKKPVFTTWPLP